MIKVVTVKAPLEDFPPHLKGALTILSSLKIIDTWFVRDGMIYISFPSENVEELKIVEVEEDEEDL